MIDPMGRILAELRASAPLATETGGRMWAGEIPEKFQGQPVPKDSRPYVLLHRLGLSRGRHNPVGTFRLSATCMHKTPRDAARLYGMVSDVLHDTGPRYTPGGTAVYRSEEEVGGQPGTDPLTGWPFEIAVYQVWAATLAVAAI